MFLTPEAVSYLDKMLKRDMKCVEYSCDVSTTWLLDRAARVHTVTYNGIACTSLFRSLNEDALARWRLNFVHCPWGVGKRGNRKHKGQAPKLSATQMECLENNYVLKNYESNLVLFNERLKYKALVHAVEALGSCAGNILAINNTEIIWVQECIKEAVPESWKRVDFQFKGKQPLIFQRSEHNGKWISSIWIT